MTSDTSLPIVVTGASGFLGCQTIPRLMKKGFSVTTVGRSTKFLSELFPSCPSIDYEKLEELAPKSAIFLHLAACNNNDNISQEEYYKINVDFLLATARAAKVTGATHFINLASTHALFGNGGDPYAQSKAAGAKQLTQEFPSFSSNIYLPIVYGDRFSGKLGILNQFPLPIAKALLAMLGLLKPKIHIDRLIDQVVKIASKQVNGTSIYIADPTTKRGLYMFATRTLDLTASFFLLIGFWWLMVIVAAWIKLDSPGPAIFAQRRIGRNGQPFICYKFRTMAENSVQAATHEVSASTVTHVGGFLRRTKIDELPQIYNILRNDMSLVGPRPCLPNQKLLVEARQVRGVLGVKPGITGLAQTRGIDMSDPIRLADVDEQYCVYRSLWGDLQILIATALGAGSGDRVAITDNKSSV